MRFEITKLSPAPPATLRRVGCFPSTQSRSETVWCGNARHRFTYSSDNNTEHGSVVEIYDILRVHCTLVFGRLSHGPPRPGVARRCASRAIAREHQGRATFHGDARPSENGRRKTITTKTVPSSSERHVHLNMGSTGFYFDGMLRKRPGAQATATGGKML